MRNILSAKGEGARRRSYLEDNLVRELKDAIGRKGEDLDKSDIAGILVEVYDDLYSRISEEEEKRKKEISAIRAEIEDLKSKLRSLKER
jgi:polyhydroxyalkanoate synthesis regulator phasin